MFNLRKYKVIKLYKIVDLQKAKEFNFKGCFNLCNNFFNVIIGKYPNDYSINFESKTWKTKKGFDKAMISKENKDIVYSFAHLNQKQSKNLFTISNSILNNTNPPNKSAIYIKIALDSSFFNNDLFINFIKLLFDELNFDYGYVVDLFENYDFETERKTNRKLFGHGVSCKEIDHIWMFHSIGINYGYLRKLYSINILNDSHLSQTVISDFVKNNVGNFLKLNRKITLWYLNENDFDISIKRLRESDYLIADEESHKNFLKTKDASWFYKQMKL